MELIKKGEISNNLTLGTSNANDPSYKLQNSNLNTSKTINVYENNRNVKQVIVLIPMTIPGNGKTFFINQLKPILQRYDIAFYSISTDDIRRRIMGSFL